MPVSKERLSAIIDDFSSKTHAVLGDMVIDEMVYGHVDRLSREAPVIILRHHKTDVVMGGGANAVHNVAAYGATTHALGVWGDDYYAPQLKTVMQNAGIHTEGMVTDASRPTTTKTRLSGMVNFSVTQQMLRLDRESREPLQEALNQQLKDRLDALLPQVNGILLSDYDLGVVNPSTIAYVLDRAKLLGVPVVVDSQSDLSQFTGATILTPNQPEAEKNVGFPLDSKQAIVKAGKILLEKAHAKHVLITLGHDGMALFDAENACVSFIPAFNKQDVFDVTGAGDTVVATWLVAYASGASALEAAVLGNLAASLVVRIFGSAVTSQGELLKSLHNLDDTLLLSITTETL
ncbi:MAG: bifunctional heptose 7-phosphate kinase/heptose 1-phosphate adenyltransferase [Vampirovibrionales bacterium]